MPWGLAAAAVAVGGSMVSANQAEIAGRDAQSKQESMQREGMDAQERMYDKGLEMQRPYREAGYSALGGIQDLLDPARRAQALTGYYNSDEYGAMSQQAEAATLRNQSAIGDLRGGNSYAALENIAPQLGQNYLNNRYNQLTGVANMGMGAASQGASGYNQLGASQANQLGAIGQGQAQQIVAGQSAQNQGLQTGINAITQGLAYYGGK